MKYVIDEILNDGNVNPIICKVFNNFDIQTHGESFTLAGLDSTHFRTSISHCCFGTLILLSEDISIPLK
jgi:hypothetical protein